MNTKENTVIVSMCTYKYNDWLIYFYEGIRKYNPDIKIVIYLINYPPEHANLLRAFFSDVEFIEKKGNFKLKPTFNEDGDKECVTYLKGQFVKEASEQFQKPVLWIDITALIRTDLTELCDLLSKNDIILNRRDFKRNEGQRVIAAEIFGVRNIEIINEYAESCNKETTNWYADQTHLADFLTKPDIKIGYIKFGDYSNFYFEPGAKSWSDRGKTGNGTFNGEDKLHNFTMFYNDLKSVEFDKEYELFIGLFDDTKPHVMCYIDEYKWCYYTTALRLCKLLSKHFYISIVRDVHIDRKIFDNFDGKLIWARCNAHRTRAIGRIRPELSELVMPTITTGGELLDSRIKLHIVHSKGKYVLTQNQESFDTILKQTNNKPFLIPNGVDTDRFKPIERNPDKRFVVGFAGRHNTLNTDKQKGFTDYYYSSCSELNLEMKECNSSDKFLPHHQMHNFYKDIDVLVQVSSSEGCSNTVQEAMSCGIPCIITKVGYHGEACTGGENVIFVDRDKEQIKEALIKLQNKKFYDKISKGARRFANRHTWETIANRFREVFEEVLK